MEAIQCTEGDVQILRVGDIRNIADPGVDILDVDFDTIGGGAELLPVLLLDEDRVDDLRLVQPPNAGADVILILFIVVKCHFVLVHLLPRLQVSVCFVHAELRVLGLVVLLLFPLLLLENGQRRVQGLFVSHAF